MDEQETAKQLEVAVQRLFDRGLQAVTDGYEVDAMLFMDTMNRIGLALTDPEGSFEDILRLVDEALEQIDLKHPRRCTDVGDQPHDESNERFSNTPLW